MNNATATTKVFKTIKEFRAYRAQFAADEKVGLVPTMGALHAGHLALIQEAKSRTDRVIVSIFVNPIQFAPHEDLSVYPRPFEGDLEACSRAGVDAIFHPDVAQMYGDSNAASDTETTKIIPPAALTERLCGIFRPGHFTGVATVVSKLFNIVTPDLAFFGEKDFQQLAVVRRMVADLNIPLEIVSVPTLREADGLAMSSRNVYLKPDERQTALALPRALRSLRTELELLELGASLGEALKRARAHLADTPGAEMQYLEVCNANTLEPMQEVSFPLCILGAMKVGHVRLIDNIAVW